MRESLIIKNTKKYIKLSQLMCCLPLLGVVHGWAELEGNVFFNALEFFLWQEIDSRLKKPEAHLSDSTSAFLYNRWSSCFCASHVRAAVLWLVLASNSLCYDLQRPESCCCVNTFYFFVLLIFFFFFLSWFLWRKIIGPHMHGVKGCIMKWSTRL